MAEETPPPLPMHARGVTRPMAEKSMREAQGEHKHGEHEHSGDDPKNGGHEHPQHAENGGGQDDKTLGMLRAHHRQTLWIYWTLVLIGLWQLVAPFTFGYLDEANWVQPSGGRGVWFSNETFDSTRAWLVTGSDVLSGLLLLFFGWRSLTPNRPVSLWICCFVGIWLTAAPVLFWAPTLASYLNDTVVGMLVIALAILIPGMPNMIAYMQHGPPQPPGWSYNPSSWPQRWIMIVAGFLGFLVSRYLAAFQFGFVERIWDPFFGFEGGTEKVLNSSMSHSLPISDAGLGTIAYTFEFLMGYMGSPARWRTMPWMVAFFGFLVIPLGLAHIFLVSSQPLIVHHWCFFCIAAAAIMLPMIPLEADEVVAMFQHLIQAKRRGDRGGSLWAIFWKGGTAEDCQKDERTPEMMEMPEKPWKLFLSSLWGMSFPWTLVAASVLGAALMVLPALFDVPIDTLAADVAHLGGALTVTVSVVAMGEVVRTGRWLNVPLGLAVAVVPWLLEDAPIAYSIVCTLVGLAVAALSIPRGRVEERFGAWDRWIV